MLQTIQTTFKRIETKYILDQDTLIRLQEDLKAHLVPDAYPTSTITNIYFDTPDFQLIRDSLAKRKDRKKVRMRTYTAHPNTNSQAFLEIKRKDEEGVGHKVRLTATACDILSLVQEGKEQAAFSNRHLTEEIHLLRRTHSDIQPMMYIYYDRFSMKGIADSKVRVTFDQNLLYRTENPHFEAGKHGQPLIEEGKIIMEVKVAGSCPDWLVALLEKHGLTEQSFSKYGTAYIQSQIAQGRSAEEVRAHA